VEFGPYRWAQPPHCAKKTKLHIFRSFAAIVLMIDPLRAEWNDIAGPVKENWGRLLKTPFTARKQYLIQPHLSQFAVPGHLSILAKDRIRAWAQHRRAE
jgi:hypothetical protein